MRRRETGIPIASGGLALIAALALASLAACAEGKLTGGDTDTAADAGADRNLRDIVRDPGTEPVVDLGSDAGDDPEAGGLDVDEPELVGECEPFSVACTDDGYAIQRCSADGELFDPFDCNFDQVCQEGDEVACVPCTPDVDCREEEPACEPNIAFCLDFQTAAQCTAEGEIGNTIGCGNGRCFGGGCTSTGNNTGETCDDDTGDDGGTGCRGRRCLCGDDDPANAGTALCAGNLASGYCTTAACDVNGCHPDLEVCADFELSGAFGGGHNCILRSSCGQRLASCAAGHRGDGHRCRELPSVDTAGVRTWALGCWAPTSGNLDQACTSDNCIAPIGGACNGDDDCIGGTCLNIDGTSYCAASCDESQGCPSYAACVRPDSGSDAHFCLARAQEQDCPRLISNFNIVARSFARLGGVQTAQVCYVRED